MERLAIIVNKYPKPTITISNKTKARLADLRLKGFLAFLGYVLVAPTRLLGGCLTRLPMVKYGLNINPPKY